MHKIDGAGNVNGTWVTEDVALLRPPTEITADIMNALQSEIVNVIEGAGFTLNKPTNTQLLSAIQAMIKGGDYKDSVRFTTTANIVLTGLGTQAGGDWPAALTAGERIFPKNQTAGAENGIWIAAAGAWTRATDADTGAELNSGAIIPVESGTVNADTNWQLSTDVAVTIGTTALTFVQTPSQFASSSEAQGFALLTKAISPGGLNAAFQGTNRSLATNGYQKLPGGLIVQWGQVSSATNSGTATFPIAFPTACLSIVASHNATLTTDLAVFNTNYLSLSQFNWVVANSATAGLNSWVSIGY